MKPLTSWKEIGAYLGRTARTVQRWEQHFGLPVRRGNGPSAGIVWALPEEIDEWLRRVEPTATDHSQRSDLHECMEKVLEPSLPAALAVVARAVEHGIKARVAIIRWDAQNGRLLPLAAPSLPKSFQAACESTTVDATVGTTGPAILLNQVKIVEDVVRNPNCDPFQLWAQKLGIGAAASVPIRSKNGHVLGALTAYYPEPCAPPADDMRRLSLAADLAAVLVERAA